MAPRVSWKAFAAALVTGIAVPVLMATRSYPWQLALPVAIAFGLLAYTSLSTVQRLKSEQQQRTHRMEVEDD